MFSTPNTNSLKKALFYKMILPYVLILVCLMSVFIYYQNKILKSDDLILQAHALSDISFQLQINTEKFLLSSHESIDRKSTLTSLKRDSLFLNNSFVEFENLFLELINSPKPIEKLNYIKQIIKDFTLLIANIQEVHEANTTKSNYTEKAESIYLASIELSTFVNSSKKDLMNHTFITNIIVLLVFCIFAFLTTKKTVLTVIHNLKEVSNYADNFSLHSSSKLINESKEFEEIANLKQSIANLKDRVQLQTRQVQQKSTSETIGEITENLAHLINNPLAIIAASAKIILKKNLTPEMVKDEAESINDCVERIMNTSLSMKKLINSKHKDDVAQFNVSVIQYGVELFFLNKFIQKNININFKFEHNHFIYAKENEILQVFFSLIDNSIKYLATKEDIENSKKWITLTSKVLVDNEITITLEDSGQNLDENIVYKAMMVQENNKLGLYAVTQTINNNNGTLEFLSKPNTKFIITLPNKKT